MTNAVPRAAATGAARRRAARVREAATAAAFLAPLVVLMVVFVYYPLADTARLSFFNYSFLKDASEFVGFDNYVTWVTDPEMWHSAWVSVLFFIFYVPTSMALGFGIAYLIDRLAGRWLPGAYRTIFYFPVVLPAAIVFHMWLNVYDPSYGPLAQMMRGLGLDEINWLGSTDLALPGLALMSVWRLIGETVILMLVGLANIPREPIEAARVDGANEWQIVRKIILPMLAPILFLIFVLRLKVLELTQEPMFMTDGGPIDATTTYGLQAYKIVFEDDALGYASTWYVLLAVFSLLVALLVGKLMRQNTEG